MNNLPFLKEKSWPRIGKTPDESKYGFSEDDELKEEAVKELMQGLHAKDYQMISRAIEALVQVIKNKQTGNDNADAL